MQKIFRLRKIFKGLYRLFNNGWGIRRVLPVLSPQEGYDRWAGSYGKQPTAVQILESEALMDLLPELKGRVVLDLGCGRGRISRVALEKGARMTVGMDLSRQMLRAVSHHPPSGRNLWLAGEALNLPFRPRVFDVVVCALMMGHVPDLPRALSQIGRVMRGGGILLISDFHPYATLRGWMRSFVEERSGKSFAIEQYCHLFSDYLRCFKEYGFYLEDLREPLFNDFPLVFIMRVRKG